MLVAYGPLRSRPTAASPDDADYHAPDAQVIHLARRRGYSIAIVPVQWSDRRGSRMRLGARLATRVLFDLALIPLVHRHVARTSGASTAS